MTIPQKVKLLTGVVSTLVELYTQPLIAREYSGMVAYIFLPRIRHPAYEIQ